MSGWTVALVVGIVWPAVALVVAWRTGRRLRAVHRAETSVADECAMAPTWVCHACAGCTP